MKSKTVSVLMRLYRGMHHLPVNLFVVFWGLSVFGPGFWWCPLLDTVMLFVLLFGMVQEKEINELEGFLGMLVFTMIIWFPYLGMYTSGAWT